MWSCLIVFLTAVQALRQVAYVSNTVSKDGFDEEVTSEILLNCRRYNLNHGITGVLIHHESSCFQLVEAPKEQIDSVMLRIYKDPRHRNIIIIMDRQVNCRSFKTWSMMFRDLKHTETMRTWAEETELLLFDEISHFDPEEPVEKSEKIDRLIKLYENLILRR